PELRRWTTPVQDTQYELKVPVGTGGVVAAQLRDAPKVDLASLKYYTVKRGETLALIARQLHVSKTDLAEANYLPAPARVVAGQKLTVPHEPPVPMAANADRPVPAAESHLTVAQAGQLAEPAATSGRIRTVYQVKQGDTLGSIARLFK